MSQRIRKKYIIQYGIIAFICSFLLYAGILSDYAFTDAYEFLWAAQTSPIFNNSFIQGGRPLAGFFNQLYYNTFIHEISDLKWARLLSLILCNVFSTIIFGFLLKFRMKLKEAAIFSFLILTLPSVTIYFGWNILYNSSIALTLSLSAGLFLIESFNKVKYFTKTIYNLFAVVLVILALCIYQPIGSAFFIPIVIYFIKTESDKKTLSRLIHITLFLAVSYALYFIIFKFSLWYSDLHPLGRSSIEIQSLPRRFIQFYPKQLKILLYGSTLLFKNKFLLSIGIISFIGFFYLILKEKKRQPYFLALFLFLLIVLPVTHLPNLLSSDTWISSRTLSPAAIIVLFYQFHFLQQMSQKYKWIKVFSWILAVCLMVFGSLNLNVFFTNIQKKEYAVLKNVFLELENKNYDKVIMVRADYGFLKRIGYNKYSFSDEYGQISSNRPWVPIPMFKQVMKEVSNEDFQNIPILTVAHNEEYEKTQNTLVINLEEILKEEFPN